MFIQQNENKSQQELKEIFSEKEEVLRENLNLKQKIQKKSQKKKELFIKSKEEIDEINNEKVKILRENEGLKQQLSEKNVNSESNLKTIIKENQKLKQLLEEKSEYEIKSQQEINEVFVEKDKYLQKNIFVLMKNYKKTHE